MGQILLIQAIGMRHPRQASHSGVDVAGGGRAGPEDRPGGVFASGDRPGPPGCGFIRLACPSRPGSCGRARRRQHRAIGLAIPGTLGGR